MIRTHTPGPWVIEHVGRVICGSMPGGALILDSNGTNGGETIAQGVGLHNENLVAAAPDLLEALEYARTALGNPVPVSKRHVARKIDAAIAKATTPLLMGEGDE